MGLTKEEIQKWGSALGEAFAKSIESIRMFFLFRGKGSTAKMSILLSEKFPASALAKDPDNAEDILEQNRDTILEGARNDLANATAPEQDPGDELQAPGHGTPAATFIGGATPDITVQRGNPADPGTKEPTPGQSGAPTPRPPGS